MRSLDRLAVISLALASAVHAQNEGDSTTPAESAAAPVAESKGILPIPDYSADIWRREYLLGDLYGARTNLAKMGIQFNVDWTNTLQSVVTGGRDTDTAIGGTADYNLTFDLMRMGFIPGALVKLRAESRYGDSVNGITGQVLPASSDQFVPLTSELDAGVPIALTTLTYTQFLSDTFGVFVGKFDTFDGDGNEFASGRGVSQFLNLNLMFSPGTLLTVPYSTLGGGVFWKPVSQLTVTSSVFTTTDCSTTSGFGHLDEGWTWSTEFQLQYQLGHLPGGANLGGTYAFDNDFASIGRRYTFAPGEGISRIPGANSSWSIYLSGWQYLFADEAAGGTYAPLDLTNGRPDRKGIGLFARMGFADQDTNPFEFTVSGGIGGRGPLPGRDNDLYGVGYFYNQIQTGRLVSALGVQDNSQGFEAFYSLAITPAAEWTFDAQVLESAVGRLDTAVVLGTRVRIRF